MEFQQASMDNIARALYTLGEQLPLFENLPAFADGRELRDEIQGLEGRVNARLDQVMDLFQQQQAHLQRQQEQLQIQQGQLQGVQEAVDNMHREFDLQPMRFYNMSAPTTGVLKGPNGPIPDDYPNKRDMLLTANAQQCIALSRYLQLPALANNVNVNQRRQQITRFLGVVM